MREHFAIGFDIGGTKCAVILGKLNTASKIQILSKRQFPTAQIPNPQCVLLEMCRLLETLIAENHIDRAQIIGIGISCGGPLDATRGIIQSPPNLPGWDEIPAVKIVTERTKLPVKLANDANAGALAEWQFGAGQGCRDMIFLTFGTGLGAGIIANGQLVTGCSGMAGECGHFRLAPDGPVGYGKSGSFEGFCSGGGIAQLGKKYAEEALNAQQPFSWCQSYEDLKLINAQMLAQAAEKGDSTARAIYAESGRHLGEGLAILIDVLNPEKIIIGSIFARAPQLLLPTMAEAIAQEALSRSRQDCQIVPAMLGEAIGDIASCAIAVEAFAGIPQQKLSKP